MKKIFILTLLLVLTSTFGFAAFAQDLTEAPTEATTSLFDMYAPSPEINDDIPKVTVDDATNWIDRKGSDIIKILQKGAQVIAVIIFVLGAIYSAFGAFGNGQVVSRGIWAMGLSLLLFSGAMFAEEIMAVFQAWITN